MPRKKIDALVEYAKGFGAKGLAYLAIHEDGTYKCFLRQVHEAGRAGCSGSCYGR